MSLGQWRNPLGAFRKMPLLKKLFWAYFLLLIFEGALRKWILPPLSAPLLLVRDPIAVWILVEAYRTNKWPEKWSTVTGLLALGFVGLCAAQIIWAENSWVAALYGLRSYLLPFPVAFIMGENLDREDLRKFGVCMLWLLLPLTALEVAQYRAPKDSWLNAGAYKGAEQIDYAGEHVRASGTFSFVAGPIDFDPLAAAFLFYGLTSKKFAKKWLLWAAAAALVLSVPLIGARSLIFTLAAVIGCAVLTAMFGMQQLVKSLKILVPLAAVLCLVSFLPIFSQASTSLKERSRIGFAAEGGVRHAVEGRTVESVHIGLADTDFTKDPIGMGMGQGANAIAKLLTGRAQFIAGEGEFGRILAELGPFPGVAFMLFRVGLALWLGWSALAMAYNHEPLALLLWPLVFLALSLGTLEQPTEQGFMVISVAFALAAVKHKELPVISPGRQNQRPAPARLMARPYWR